MYVWTYGCLLVCQCYICLLVCMCQLCSIVCCSVSLHASVWPKCVCVRDTVGVQHQRWEERHTLICCPMTQGAEDFFSFPFTYFFKPWFKGSLGWSFLSICWYPLGSSCWSLLICHPFNSNQAFGCYFSSLPLWSSAKCSCCDWMAKKVKKGCYIIFIVCLRVWRVSGVFMAADACAANSEPPTHKWSWKSNSLLLIKYHR